MLFFCNCVEHSCCFFICLANGNSAGTRSYSFMDRLCGDVPGKPASSGLCRTGASSL
ncbi:MAG TPA: hypothetical protein PKJ95_07225 [Atribacterota bacterium]|nr:hypothetical protein [Atribacterota bacterium]